VPLTAELARAYDHCHEVVAARAKNFVYAFLLLPPARRRGLEAIYAYCRLADDFADDDDLASEERARLLSDLRARLRRAIPLAGDPPLPELAPCPRLDPVMAALADTARRYGVRRRDLDLVAIGCEQDLVKARYANWAELSDYCFQVASCVGLACLDVFGYRGESEHARALATDLGLAMQLTNIIRDVAEDLERDRIYLPADELLHHGVSTEQLLAGKVDAAWRSFLASQVARARDLFAQAAPLATLVRRRSRICPMALATIYQAVLDEVEAADYDVFSHRASLGGNRKLALLGVALGKNVASWGS
jgi:phytoene synthase